MKHAELTTGTEYLFSDDRDWQSRPYGHSKVKLASEQRVTRYDGYTRSRGNEFVLLDGTTVTLHNVRADSTGRAVLVEVLEGRNAGSVKAVPLNQLRGEWDEAKAESKDTLDAEARAIAARAAADRFRRDELATLREQLVELGLVNENAASYRVTSPRPGEVSIPMTVLTALLNNAR